MSRISSKSKPKRSVTSKSETKSQINNSLSPNEVEKESNILFDFSYYRPFSVKNSVFTNFYHSPEDYIRTQQQLIESILHFSQFKMTDVLNRQNTSHSHRVKKEKYKIINSILKSYDFKSINQDIDVEDLYQLGQSQGLRIIGYFDLIAGQRYFYPIFIDPHHLIHGDLNYNNKDTNNFKYSNLEKSVNEKCIKLLSYDDAICEDCYDCEKLITYLET